MKHAELSKEMTVYDLAQLMVAGFDRLESRVECLEENCSMKSDLDRFATKKDLEKHATKDDLINFATRDDLLKMEKRLSDKIDRTYYSRK